MPDESEKRTAALAWAASGAFGPVVPLIIFALNYKTSKFIGFHALQAALSFLSMVASAMVVGLVMGGGTAWVVLRDGMPDANAAMPEPLRIVMLLVGGLTVAVYVGLVLISLRFAASAMQGAWIRYPLANRLAATLYDVSDIRVPVSRPETAQS
ncbi:MAG: DUF4870 domain-containing protein [Nannocystaceae bacterium]|nr:DUF4870 domain-containing protein [Nannocystaceae bacterium]